MLDIYNPLYLSPYIFVHPPLFCTNVIINIFRRLWIWFCWYSWRWDRGQFVF